MIINDGVITTALAKSSCSNTRMLQCLYFDLSGQHLNKKKKTSAQLVPDHAKAHCLFDILGA
jgi:hypothetical protein